MTRLDDRRLIALARSVIEADEKAVHAARGISIPVEAAATAVAEALLAGRRVLAFGNGGSATQSQHLAAELVVRYRDERRVRLDGGRRGQHGHFQRDWGGFVDEGWRRCPDRQRREYL